MWTYVNNARERAVKTSTCLLMPSIYSNLPYRLQSPSTFLSSFLKNFFSCLHTHFSLGRTGSNAPEHPPLTPLSNRYQTCTKPDVDLPVSTQADLYLGRYLVRTSSKKRKCIKFGTAHQEMQTYFSIPFKTTSATMEKYSPYVWSWYTYATGLILRAGWIMVRD